MTASDMIEIKLTPEETAFHEAGHVVAHLAYMSPFRCVTLRPRDKNAGGHVVVRPGAELAWKNADMCAAGPYAHTVYDGGPSPWNMSAGEQDLRGWESDLDAVDEYVKGFEPGKRSDVLLSVWERTADLIVPNWDVVKQISNALLERKTLTEREAKAIGYGPDDPA